MSTSQKIQYTHCKHCNTKIAKTQQNPEGKCPFRFCKGYGYNSQTPQDTNLLNKYEGKSVFTVDLGDVLHCIDIIDNNKLLCLTAGYPTVHILTEREFNQALSTQYLHNPLT